MKTSASLLIAFVLSVAPAFGQTRVSTEDFVKKVAISDMMEIQSSQLALSKNPDADTKPFAEKMVKDHQQTSTELKGLVSGGKVIRCPPRSTPSIRKSSTI
jgi:putative membrane protein